MEKRWTQRSQVDLEVDVTTGDGGTLGCRTRDICLGGVFVKLSNDLKLPQDTPVELMFKLDKGESVTRHRIKAKVVRITDEGAGMMFRDFDAGAFRSLQELLKYRAEVGSVEIVGSSQI